jgi:hypothetical protein
MSDFDDLPLFQTPPPHVRGMVRNPDRPTSIAAAESVVAHLSELQERVLAYLRTVGPSTDEQIAAGFEGMDGAKFGQSTLRSRRSDLVRKRLVVPDGEATNARGRRVMVWKVAP